MATFTYKAARPSGATLDGLIDGDDERAAQSKLESDGYIVIDLQSRRELSPGLLFDLTLQSKRLKQ